MDAAIYLRQSLDRDGNELGITRQLEDCLRLCADKGWAVHDKYSDNDTSASSGARRKHYERMLADIRDGRVGAVVVWDLDRLHRRPIELESFMALADEKQIKLASVSGDVDLSTAQGRLIARLKGSVAAHEIDHKRARQKRAAQQKAEQGRPQWRRAFGYLDTPAGPVPNPEIAPLVREGYAAIQAGSSLKDVARLWNDAGALTESWRKKRGDHDEVVIDPETGKAVMICTRKPWNESLVSQFLRNPRNAGLRSHGEEIVGKGTWEPLVDEGLWRAVQATMNHRAGSLVGQRRAARRHLLTAMMHCSKCGHYLAGQWVMQKTGGKPGRPKAGQTKEPHPGTLSHRVTYTCKGCHGVSIRADDVEPLLTKLIGKRLARADAVDLLKTEAHDAAEAQAIRDEKAELYGRLDELAVERAQGLMTGRQLQIASEVIQQQIETLERKEQDQERLRVFDGIPLGTEQAIGAVEKLTPDRFRAVLSILCNVTILPVGKGSHMFKSERVKVDWI